MYILIIVITLGGKGGCRMRARVCVCCSQLHGAATTTDTHAHTVRTHWEHKSRPQMGVRVRVQACLRVRRCWHRVSNARLSIFNAVIYLTTNNACSRVWICTRTFELSALAQRHRACLCMHGQEHTRNAWQSIRGSTRSIRGRRGVRAALA